MGKLLVRMNMEKMVKTVMKDKSTKIITTLMRMIMMTSQILLPISSQVYSLSKLVEK